MRRNRVLGRRVEQCPLSARLAVVPGEGESPGTDRLDHQAETGTPAIVDRARPPTTLSLKAIVTQRFPGPQTSYVCAGTGSRVPIPTTASRAASVRTGLECSSLNPREFMMHPSRDVWFLDDPRQHITKRISTFTARLFKSHRPAADNAPHGQLTVNLFIRCFTIFSYICRMPRPHKWSTWRGYRHVMPPSAVATRRSGDALTAAASRPTVAGWRP